MKQGTSMSTDEVRRSVTALGDWFHNMDLGGVRTAPNHFLGDYPMCKWRSFADAVPADLSGRTVLDIGCNGGFYSIEMKRRGADRVVGIDSDGRYLAQARLAAEVSGVDIELKQMSVYEIGRLEERFDLVLFMGVLYHLRHPLLALDLIHEHVARDLLIAQSLLRGNTAPLQVAPDYPFSEVRVFDDDRFPRLCFIEDCYAGDWTNWWVPNKACMEAMLRSAGFVLVSNPEPEVFVCKYRPAPSETQAAYAAKGADDHG